MVSPSAVKFMDDHFIFGDTYRCVLEVREYRPTTSDQAILSRFGDKENVTLHIYRRYVDAAEQRKIIQNAQRKNKMLSTSEELQESIKGEGNMNDVIELLAEMRRTKEPLLHCAVFIELSANSLEKLTELQTEVLRGERMRYGKWDAGHIMKNGVTVYDSRIKRKPARFEPI